MVLGFNTGKFTKKTIFTDTKKKAHEEFKRLHKRGFANFKTKTALEGFTVRNKR